VKKKNNNRSEKEVIQCLNGLSAKVKRQTKTQNRSYLLNLLLIIDRVTDYVTLFFF